MKINKHSKSMKREYSELVQNAEMGKTLSKPDMKSKNHKENSW